MTRATASALALGTVAVAVAAAVVDRAWLVPAAVTGGVGLTEWIGGRYWPTECGRRALGRVLGRAAACGTAAAALLVVAGSVETSWPLRAAAGPALAAVLAWVLPRLTDAARA